MAVYITLKFL